MFCYVRNFDGKGFSITGATCCIGFELTKLLYAAGGAFYMSTRNESSAIKAMGESICRILPESCSLHPHRDLADLFNIATTAKEFDKSSSRLDVCWIMRESRQHLTHIISSKSSAVLWH